MVPANDSEINYIMIIINVKSELVHRYFLRNDLFYDAKIKNIIKKYFYLLFLNA